MPKQMRWTVILLATLALVPFALIARARTNPSPKPRLHVFFDMDNQPRYEAQQASPLFRDGRAARPWVEGTVARGADGLRADDARYLGHVGGAWVERFPASIDVDESLMLRGRERYDVFCAPCHGITGVGDGAVARRAEALQEGTWVPPLSFHDAVVRERPVGHLFNTITNGIRNMPAYGARIPVEDRWAIVAYVRALQRSRTGTVDDVPAENRAALEAAGGES